MTKFFYIVGCVALGVTIMQSCSNNFDNEREIPHNPSYLELPAEIRSLETDLDEEPLSQVMLNGFWMEDFNDNKWGVGNWVVNDNINPDNPDTAQLYQDLAGVVGGYAHLIQLGISGNYFYYQFIPPGSDPRAFISAFGTEITWGILPFSFSDHYIYGIKDSDGNAEEYAHSNTPVAYEPWKKDHPEQGNSWYSITVDPLNRAKIVMKTNETSKFRWVMLWDTDKNPSPNPADPSVKDTYITSSILLVQFPWSDNAALVEEAPTYNDALRLPTSGVNELRM